MNRVQPIRTPDPFAPSPPRPPHHPGLFSKKAWEEITAIGHFLTGLANWTIRVLLILCLAWWLSDRMELEAAREKEKAKNTIQSREAR